MDNEFKILKDEVKRNLKKTEDGYELHGGAAYNDFDYIIGGYGNDKGYWIKDTSFPLKQNKEYKIKLEKKIKAKRREEQKQRREEQKQRREERIRRCNGEALEKDIEIVMIQLEGQFTREQIIESFKRNDNDLVNVIMDLNLMDLNLMDPNS